MKLCLAPCTCHCCFPHSLPYPKSPQIPLAAEIIQKECLALVEQMTEREREDRADEGKQQRSTFLCCCEGLSVQLFPGNHKAVPSAGSSLPWVFFSGAHHKRSEKLPVKCKDLRFARTLLLFSCFRGCLGFACGDAINAR